MPAQSANRFEAELDSAGMRILIIEDERDIGQLLARHIAAQGFVVDVVASIQEARAAASLADYGLILLDRRLPDGDGLDLIQLL